MLQLQKPAKTEEPAVSVALPAMQIRFMPFDRVCSLSCALKFAPSALMYTLQAPSHPKADSEGLQLEAAHSAIPLLSLL